MEDLIRLIENSKLCYDAIVVEGYDGVGKGRVLNKLSEVLKVTPYRPDYNLWQKYSHHQPDRWKVSGFFWDIFSHFHHSSGSCAMLFDRGVISGAVYNDDLEIARDYPKMLRDMKVLHILVTCDEESYKRFQRSRFTKYLDEDDLECMWLEALNYTRKYEICFKEAGVEYIVFENQYDDSLSRLSETCEGCGHHSYGYCRHPDKNCEVDPKSLRCELAEDMEVQDLDDAEMCSV